MTDGIPEQHNVRARSYPARITAEKGKPAGVLLDLKTYGRLRQAEEALADIRAYDAARPKVAAELNHDRELRVVVITLGHRRDVYR